MNRIRKRTIAIGSAIAVAAAGGGVAYAAATDSDRSEALLRGAAQRLNVEPEELRSALEGAFGDQLDRAVAGGKLTREQADRIEQQVREHGLPLGGPLHGPDHHVMLAGPGGPFGIGLDAAADYLGLTRAQLGRKLMSGRTLAQIASAEGTSVDGLEQALLDAAASELDRAVADGDLTDEQRDQMLRRLEEHVDDLVAGKGPHPGPGPHRFKRHIGPGSPGGPPPLWGADERHEHHAP